MHCRLAVPLLLAAVAVFVFGCSQDSTHAETAKTVKLPSVTMEPTTTTHDHTPPPRTPEN